MNIENRKRVLEVLNEIDECRFVLERLKYPEKLNVDIVSVCPQKTIVTSASIDERISMKFIEEVRASYDKRFEKLKKELETL